MILSLSNGVNQYIQSIEEETLSEYPLQIQSTGFDITSMMTDVHPGPGTEEKDESKIYVSQMITNMFSKIGSNDLIVEKVILKRIQIQLNIIIMLRHRFIVQILKILDKFILINHLLL